MRYLLHAWPQFSQCYQTVLYIISAVICNQSSSSKNSNMFLYIQSLICLYSSVVLFICCLFVLFVWLWLFAFSVSVYFSFPFASSPFPSPNYATGSIHANGKSLTWHSCSCTVIIEHQSWHHCFPFHKITKFSSNLKCWKCFIVCAGTNICTDERCWTCSLGSKMPSLGFMVASIHPEAVVRIKWALLSTNLILLRAAVSQHFNSSWEKATGKGRYSQGNVLLIIKMVSLK